MNDTEKIVQQEIAPCENKKQSHAIAKKRKYDPSAISKDIARIAVFCALAIVINFASSSMPKTDIFGTMSVLYAFAFVTAFYLGAWRGGIALAIADFLIAMVYPFGGMPWMPLITLSNFMLCFIPGVVFHLRKNKNLAISMFIAIPFMFVICTLGFSALGETILYNMGFVGFYAKTTLLINATELPVYIAFIVRKSITQPIWYAVNFAIALIIFHAMPKNIKKLGS